MVVLVDMIWSKAAPEFHIVLGEKGPHSLVDLLTYLNDNLFYGANVSEKPNNPCLCNGKSCLRAPSEVKTRVP